MSFKNSEEMVRLEHFIADFGSKTKHRVKTRMLFLSLFWIVCEVKQRQVSFGIKGGEGKSLLCNGLLGWTFVVGSNAFIAIS